MKDYINSKKNIKPGNEGSSLAIALFFFMLCALICAGILYVANSSIFGISKNFNADNVIPYVSPAPLPDPTPTPELDENHMEESLAIKLVYDTLSYDLNVACKEAEIGGEGKILASQNPRNITYEMISFINSYINNKKKESDGQTYFVPVDNSSKEMLPLEYTVTINDIPVKVVFDFDGTAPETKANSILAFNAINITISSGVEGSDCKYIRTSTYEVPGDGKLFIRWANNPKRFLVKNK